MNRQFVLDTLSQQRDEIMRTYGLRRLAIFGSIARDEFGEDSDLDVLIEFNEGEATFEHYMDLKFHLEDHFGVKVDLVTEYSLRPEFRSYVEQDAIEIA